MERSKRTNDNVRRNGILLVASALAAVLAMPRIASAQPHTSGLSGELEYGHTSLAHGSGNAFGLDLGLLITPGALGFGAEIGAVTASYSRPLAVQPDEGSYTKYDVTNPFIGAFFSTNLAIVKLRVGGGLALPIAADDGALALATVSASRGYWNIWSYTPKTLSVVVPARIEASLAGLVGVAGEAAIAAMVPTANTDLRSTDFAYQLAAEAYIGLGIEPGLRLQEVHVPTAKSGGDRAQVSAMPFVRFGAGPVHLEAELTFNLTDPKSFDTAGTWGAHVGAAVSL